MNLKQAKIYAEQELSAFIGTDMLDLSNQAAFAGMFSKVIREFHRQGVVIYNEGHYNLTLSHSGHGFEGDLFYPCWLYNPMR